MCILRELPTLLTCFGIATLALLVPRHFPRLRWVQRLPPPLWCYGVPMILRGLNLFPISSPFLQDFISFLLPTALFLVLLPTPMRHLWHLGPRALGAMLAGSLGIVLGGPIAFGVFQTVLPTGSWRPLSLLSATWIGGSLNMLAMREILQVPESLLGPMILVDSLIAYSWFAFLLLLIPYQPTVNGWLRAKPILFQERKPTPSGVSPSERRLLLIGLVLAQMLLCLIASALLPPFWGLSQKTWGILLATVAALSLSRSHLAQQEKETEMQWGQFLLFLVLAALGFRGDIRTFLQTPIFLLVGIVWVAIHAVCLFLAGKLLRLPLGLLATASQANIGGVVSTPLVGAAYDPALVSVGLLLAILGNILGTPLGLVCASLMRRLAAG